MAERKKKGAQEVLVRLWNSHSSPSSFPDRHVDTWKAGLPETIRPNLRGAKTYYPLLCEDYGIRFLFGILAKNQIYFLFRITPIDCKLKL